MIISRTQHVLLATDALYALFDSSSQMHTHVVSLLTEASKQAREPLYPYPALLGLYDAVIKSKDTRLRERINTVVGEIAQSPLIEMPTREDVALSSLLMEQTFQEGWKLSPADATVVAMAVRLRSLVLTFDQHLASLASRHETVA